MAALPGEDIRHAHQCLQLATLDDDVERVIKAIANALTDSGIEAPTNDEAGGWSLRISQLNSAQSIHVGRFPRHAAITIQEMTDEEEF